jgi:phosphate uptake regulator
LAKLVVFELTKAIENGNCRTEMYRKLIERPSELKKLYERILRKITLEERHHTFNYLQVFEILSDYYQDLIAMTLAIKPSVEALT